MIDVQSLSRHYGKTVAVDNVSFSIGNNEVVGLLGHNGAGKTTIMRMLSGYLEPSAGTITVDGVNLADNPRAVQQHLGYLPENLPVYPDMMVADYLDYAATLKGIDKKHRMDSVQAALAATDLTQRALAPVRTLSRGLRQRVGVAQALLGRPRLLIFDEPTNGLDPKQTEQMRQLIRRLARRATVILSTHIMQEVDAVCDRVLMLRAGELALDQKLEALYHSGTLQLRTDSSVQELGSQLQRLPQVASVEHRVEPDGLTHFDIHLHPNANADTASNNVAQCVVRTGARLYQLALAQRDLHSVFHEVNTDDE